MVSELQWEGVDVHLRTLSEAGLRPVVVGGQALNAWSDYFSARGRNVDPIASKDLDLVGSTSDARKAAQILGSPARWGAKRHVQQPCVREHLP